MRNLRKHGGFTLIEVLLALSVIAIALTALLRATSQNTVITTRIKNKTIGHWVAMQGIASLQLGRGGVQLNQENTQKMMMAGEVWYWRSIVTSTSIKHMQKISVRISQRPEGGFSEPIIAFRYVS